MSGATITGSLADSLRDMERGLKRELALFGVQNVVDLQEEIEAETPVDTGRLASSYYITGPKMTTNTMSWKINTDVDYAPWVEWDTGRHKPGGQYIIITPKRSKYLRFRGRTGDIVYTKLVRHPGSKGAHMFAKGADAIERQLPASLNAKLRELAWKHGFRYNGVIG